MTDLSAGTKITCTNGHHIATVKDGIKKYDLIRTSQFDFTPGNEHVAHEAIRGCGECGAAFQRFTNGGGVNLHTEDGWTS